MLSKLPNMDYFILYDVVRMKSSKGCNVSLFVGFTGLI